MNFKILTYEEIKKLDNEQFILYFSMINSGFFDPECECGAKHTSNPKFHLKYCPLAKRG